MAHKRETITDEEAQRVRKAIWWIAPMFLALAALTVGLFLVEPDPIGDVRAGEPLVSVWPMRVMAIPFTCFMLAALVTSVFRAIPWPAAFERAQQALVGFMWLTLAAIVFALVGVRPISNHFMPKYGYHRCERFEEGATRLWFTDWVKDPNWCVPHKGRDWVKAQAAKEAANGK